MYFYYLLYSYTFIAHFMQYLHSVFWNKWSDDQNNFSVLHINMVDINMILMCCSKLMVSPLPVTFISRKPFNAQSLFISQPENNNARSILLNICTISAVF